MRVTIPIKVKRIVQAHGWASGVRLVEEGANISILEGDPSQFEALYDDMNHISTSLAFTASAIRLAIDNVTPK